MTIETTVMREVVQGNGATTAFSFPNIAIPSSGDLQVYYTDASDVTTLLVYGTDYTATGFGTSETGITLTYPLVGTILQSGESLTLVRELEIVQETDLINQSGYYPDVVEHALDYRAMVEQQLQDEYGRGIRLSTGDPSDGDDMVLGDVATRALYFLGFDADGAVAYFGANEILAYLLTVDGAGSGLDADLLDGQHGSYYDDPTLILNRIKTVDGPGSGLDADTLDGFSSDDFVRSGSNLGAGAGVFKVKSVADLQHRSLVAGANVTITQNADTITIASAGIGGGTGQIIVPLVSQIFSGNGVTTTFTLTSAPENEDQTFVHVGGVYQQKNTYSISGMDVVFTTAPPSGTNNIEVVWGDVTGAVTFSDFVSGFIEAPTDKAYRLMLNVPYGFNVDYTSVRSSAGTGTATFSINATPLGGGANAISTTENTVNHGSANVATVGDDVTLTVSGSASLADLSFTIAFTR